jgi:hypothetical protein
MSRGRSRWLGTVFCATIAALTVCTWAKAGPAELVILAVTPSDPHPVVGEAISVVVLVENQGSSDSGPFDVALFENPAAEPTAGDSSGLSLPVSSLNAGAQTTVVFAVVTSPASGVWSMYVIADNGLAVAESDETNNVSGPISVVWHASPYLGSGCSAGLHGGAVAGPAWSLVFPILFAAFAFRRRAKVEAPVPGSGGRGSSGPRWI